MLRSLFFLIVVLFTCSAYATSSKKMIINNGKIFQPTERDLIYGDKNAPIQVLEYFTLTCPHCENFFVNIFPKLKEEYIDTGKVMWIKRSFVTDFSSAKGTSLLYCLDKKDYEKYLSILLVKQASWAYQKDPIPVLKNIAALGGMNAKEFNACMDNKEIIKEINTVAEDAKKILKISGTPVFYINQEKVSIYSYKSFKDYVDNLLEKNKKTDESLDEDVN